MRGDSSVAGERRVVGLPKFHSWGKCNMPLTNINSDWMSNASSSLRLYLKQKALEFRVLWLLYPQGRSQTSVYRLSTARHAFTSFILARYARSSSPKHNSALNTCSNDFIHSMLNVTSHTRKSHFRKSL